MKAAIIRGVGQTPVYADFAEPVAREGEVTLAVSAAALTPFTKLRASAQQPGSAAGLPAVAGLDGVGSRDDGRRVFFMLPRPPYGSIAERTVVSATHTVPVPDGLDSLTAAAIANPGTSSWAALKEHARLVPGEVVFVNGATGSAGRLAVQIAKLLGASKVIATGRNAAALDGVTALGADVTIPLDADPASLVDALSEQFAGEIHVVLDYLWGPSAEQILQARARAGGSTVTRYVQIGSASSQTITLSSEILRLCPVHIMGSGLGSLSTDRLFLLIAELLSAVIPAGLQIATRVVPISEVEQAWSSDAGMPRTVFAIL